MCNPEKKQRSLLLLFFSEAFLFELIQVKNVGAKTVRLDKPEVSRNYWRFVRIWMKRKR